MLRSKFIKIFSLFLATFLFFTTPVSALSTAEVFGEVKLPAGREDEWAENNFLFYNPSGTARNNNACTTEYGGDVSVSGSEAEQKVWSAFRSVGFTKEQTAGIMGNVAGESGFNPVQHEISLYNKYWKSGGQQVDGHFDLSRNESISYGLGLIQFSFDWRTEMYKYVTGKSPDTAQYFNNPEKYSYTYGLAEKVRTEIGDAAFDKLIALQVEYLTSSAQSSGYTKRITGMKDKTTVADAAGYWAASVEICSKCSAGTEEYSNRVKKAQAYYDKFADETFIASSGGSGGTEGSQTVSATNVTIIGDSITNGSKSYLQNLIPKASIDAQDGRPWESGLNILKNTSSVKTLVFALGTNNWSPQLTATKVQEVVDLAKQKGATKIIFVTNYNSSDENKYSVNNLAFKQAQQNNNEVTVVDWATSAKSKNISFDSMSVHPSDETGKKLFAELIANAVGSSSSGSGAHTTSGCVNGGSGTGFSGDTNIGSEGLTYEQAKQFMMNYGENKSNSSANAMGSSLWGMCNGGGSNCVSFSAFFLNKFTSTKYADGNGKDIVNNLSGVQKGSTPQVFAVFSVTNSGTLCDGVPCGHTGIILGKEGNDWIVGHASCSSSGKGKGDGVSKNGSGFVIKSSNITTALWAGGTATYAYPTIDTASISSYLSSGV